MNRGYSIVIFSRRSLSDEDTGYGNKSESACMANKEC